MIQKTDKKKKIDLLQWLRVLVQIAVVAHDVPLGHTPEQVRPLAHETPIDPPQV